jgi:phosphate transport system substrate-binding protein
MKGMMLCAIALLLFGCADVEELRSRDSANEGTIYISADEAFRPVIEEQIRVYEALHPKTKIIARYKSEAECWNDLMEDTIRMVIVTKKITEEEAAYYNDSLGIYPQSGQVAWDAVALVVNRQAPDSVFTMADVKAILKGNSRLPYKPVFDGTRATSTVRYALDSILAGESMDLQRVTAARSSREVVEYISNHPGYIGFTGVSWVGNPEDTAQLRLLKKVRIAWLSCRTCPDSSFTKPMQEEILTNRYPYTRGIFYVIKEKHTGLGTAFVNFMKSDQGQLIFRRAYLVPAWRPFIVRETQMKLVKPIKQ